MCIRNVDVPEEKAGYGYKIVEKLYTDDNGNQVYGPEWPSFHISHLPGEGAGTKAKYNGYNEYGEVKFVIFTSLEYRLMETARPEKPNITVAQNGDRYVAGIHLYKRQPYNGNREMAVLRCHYNHAIATDGEVIVAMEITPIEEVFWSPSRTDF
jgi:hypothetical protein